MKRIPFLGATIALFVPALHLAAQEAEKAPATVVVTGKCTSYASFSFQQLKIRVGDNIQKQLADALNQAAVVLGFDLDAQTHLFVISTPKAAPGPLDAVFVFAKKHSAVAGRLIRSDNPDLIKALDAKKPGHVWLLVSDSITLVDDKNKTRFPIPAMAQVEGEMVSGDFSAGKHKSRLGIKNGAAGPIMLAGPAAQAASETRGRVRAAGKLEVIDGALILTAEKIEAVKASNAKGPGYSKLWRQFDPKSPLAACRAHFDEIDEHGARAGLSFNDSPDTYKLFNAAGTISADKLKQLLAALKTDLHKMAKGSGVEKVGEPSDKVEDRPISVLRAMYSQRLIMPGSVRGFYLTYRDGKVAGAIDVIAVLNSSAIDRWEICCAVHEQGIGHSALGISGPTPNAERSMPEKADAKAQVEKLLDDEYLKNAVPFKVEPFRRRGPAGRVVLVELLTGLDCRPCVAANVAFDAALKAYKPRDVILLHYIGALGNADAARFANFQNNARYGAIPCTHVSGGVDLVLGGGKAAGQDRYARLAKAIEEKLAGDTSVKISLTVKRTGDELVITVAVAGLASPGPDTKLRLALFEEAVRCPAANGVRIHHHVVRAMPGGADGFALKEATAKQEMKFDLAALRKSLGVNPLGLKHLAVAAFIQNDKTREVLQATQAEVQPEK